MSLTSIFFGGLSPDLLVLEDFEASFRNKIADLIIENQANDNGALGAESPTGPGTTPRQIDSRNPQSCLRAAVRLAERFGDDDWDAHVASLKELLRIDLSKTFAALGPPANVTHAGSRDLLEFLTAPRDDLPCITYAAREPFPPLNAADQSPDLTTEIYDVLVIGVSLPGILHFISLCLAGMGFNITGQHLSEIPENYTGPDGSTRTRSFKTFRVQRLRRDGPLDPRLLAREIQEAIAPFHEAHLRGDREKLRELCLAKIDILVDTLSRSMTDRISNEGEPQPLQELFARAGQALEKRWSEKLHQAGLSLPVSEGTIVTRQQLAPLFADLKAQLVAVQLPVIRNLQLFLDRIAGADGSMSTEEHHATARDIQSLLTALQQRVTCLNEVCGAPASLRYKETGRGSYYQFEHFADGRPTHHRGLKTLPPLKLVAATPDRRKKSPDTMHGPTS